MSEHIKGRPDSSTTEGSTPPPRAAEPTDFATEEDEGFRRWQSCSVRHHKDPERAVVTILVPLGDLGAETLRTVSRIVATHSEGQARIARDQNLVLSSVHLREIRRVYDELKRAGLVEAGVGTALDITACPGADTCALGITTSKGLTRALRSEVERFADRYGLEEIRGTSIKISGCPNSCGQHHIAGLGFHGVVKKVGGRQVPAYQLHWGGRIDPGDARIGESREKIPAKHIPKVVSVLLELYRDQRQNGESWADFAERFSREKLSALLEPWVEDRSPGNEIMTDWGQQQPFSTQDIGQGECAGAGTDAMDDPFDNYRAELKQAEFFMNNAQWGDALANLNRSQYTLAQVLLEQLGKKPASDYETTCELRGRIIDRGYASELWNEIHAEIESLLRTREPDPDRVRSLSQQCVNLLEESKGTLAWLKRGQPQAVAVDVPG